MGGQVIIIGGGASGMTAAVMAARGGAAVTVLEHMDRVGKKILSTGNGRCNFTNQDQKPEYYHCGQADFPWRVLEQFPMERTVEFFAELGILAKERNGCLYPNSDQASSVLDALRFELERLQIRVTTGCQVREIRPEGNGFSVRTDQGKLSAGAVVLAAGSKAAPSTGSDGSGYELARGLGHRIVTPLPALVQLRCAEKDYKQLAGVRTDAKIDLYVEMSRAESAADRTKRVPAQGSSVDGSAPDSWRLAASDRGELQLTDYGISGIPVFQVSRYASAALHSKKRVKAVIDFLPRQTQEETMAMLCRRAASMPERTCEQWMCGLLNKKLSLVLLKRAGLKPSECAGCVGESGWAALGRQLRAFETVITAANSFDQAQVCCGGVDTLEVDPATMMSRKGRGLYLAGEILDVDGICGGYNLQWAWSSGAVAGANAARYASAARYVNAASK